MKRYYKIHVFYNENDEFTNLFEIETQRELTEDEIMILAIESGQLDDTDAKYVDSISEITEGEFITFRE